MQSVFTLFFGLSFLFCLLCFPVSASAQTPLFSKNQSPFVRIFGMPAAESGQLLHAGGQQARLITDIANNLTISANSGEYILLDGETVVSTVMFRYGLRKDLELGLDLPYVIHEKGGLDYFIEDWHDFFHLPDGHRKKRSANILEYRYERDGQLFHLQNKVSDGPGDVQLSLAIPFFTKQLGEGRDIALRTALKLPTGNSADLHGSGAADFSIRLSGMDQQTFSALGLNFWGAAGILYLGRGDVLEDLQRMFVFFGTLGGSWQFFERLELKIQLDANTAFYHSALTELGTGAVLLSTGGTLHLPAGYELDLGVIEDIAVYTAPDVTFHLALRKIF